MNPLTGLSTCFNIGLGYAGGWYAGAVYAGTPFCLALIDLEPTPTPESNVRDFCLIRC